jgi:hypothetical protein
MQSTQARRISYLKIGVYIGQVWSVTHPLQVRKREKMASYGIPSRFRLNYRLLQDGNRTERDIGVHRLATLIDEKDGLRVETDWDVKEICMGESDPAVEKR